MNNKFTISDIYDVFKKKSCFLYHGVGNGMGAGANTNIDPLQHLKNALSTNYELCCSTISSGDSLYTNNYFGELGFILKIKHPDSITYICPNDAGSSKTANNRRHTTYGISQPIGLSDVEDSITNRGISYLNLPGTAWNEWGVQSYDVFGLFIDTGLPFSFFINNQIVTIGLNNIENAFPGMNIYARDHVGDLRQVFYCPKNHISWGSSITISNIYP
ncbi:hypothetical protein AUQ44_02245 [Vibrio cidicii]|uniref:Uncharacterized protein n=1 Tax=Vibrio cidicii TaxID=1763883 RepID=A0A151JGH1_9VIBR|nr:hypothetical protein [Vibrio cholerae]KYN24727.1 hypothetical protein AUQ44_02245 [Vibrio cidicii]